MRKYFWLLVLALPPWAAVELHAPKWALMVSMAPFFLLAMTLGDPDEHLLGEASKPFRKGALMVIGVSGLVLACLLLVLWHVLSPH